MPRRPSPLRALPFALLLLPTVHCASAPAEDAASSADEAAMSKAVHDTYGMTVFGGPGDYQPLACGGNSRTTQPWFVASSQRYGCHARLKISAGGKCLVVQTEDAGPASWVESRAGVPILDSGPEVGKYMFGTTDLGYSDLRAHPGRYEVRVERTSDPLGPCGGGSGSSTGSGSSGGGAGSGSSPSGSAGSASCHADGDCNPGNDGSGLICVSGQCVPGCHTAAQCPGSTSCVNGTCE